jgi:exo-beta-1,3-glucanase (GH17 family)
MSPSPLISDPQAVTILAPELAPLPALLDSLAPFGTGDVFCASAPDDDPEDDDYSDFLGDDEFAYYSATVSDTVATFLVEVERADPSSAQTRYEVHVTDSGPGADRLRYRLAKAVLAVTRGSAVDASGSPSSLSAPAQDPFGALW